MEVKKKQVLLKDLQDIVQILENVKNKLANLIAKAIAES